MARVAISILLGLTLGLAYAPRSAQADVPAYESSIERIDAPTRALMKGRSWHAGCPVPIKDLRYLEMRHRTFDGGSRMGEMVVHERWADEVVAVFETIYDAGFRIRRMRLVDHYGADDGRSMARDNTSAFNCRWRANSPGVWSQHAYGRAMDINPVENPYFVPPNDVSPDAGAAFLDRSRHKKGMIHGGDNVVMAFEDIGWEWGGNWTSEKDWQHFSANGK